MEKRGERRRAEDAAWQGETEVCTEKEDAHGVLNCGVRLSDVAWEVITEVR